MSIGVFGGRVPVVMQDTRRHLIIEIEGVDVLFAEDKNNLILDKCLSQLKRQMNIMGRSIQTFQPLAVVKERLRSDITGSIWIDCVCKLQDEKPITQL